MKVIVDVNGADRGPGEVIKGCIEALADSNAVIVLAGQKSVIEAELQNYQFDAARIEILDAPEIVTNEDSPTNVIREKKNSSMVMGLERTKNDDAVVGLVSAGNSGALLTGATLIVKRIKGVSRPVLAPLIPTMKETPFTVVDSGANMDCKPEYLVQFGIMGSHYMRAMCGIESPRVAMVSVGTEDKKGNELSKTAFDMLKNLPEGTLNFVGNMEGREAMSGDYDVLVCDGFVGNVLIKTLEGTALVVMKMLKNEIMESKRAKIGAMFMKKALGNLKKKMDYSGLGGAAFLGVEKIIIKTHGSSKAATVRASINQVVKMHELDVINKIKASLSASAGEQA